MNLAGKGDPHIPKNDIPSNVIQVVKEWEVNKEIDEYKKKTGQTLVKTTEPAGAVKKKFTIVCAECHTPYFPKADNDLELQLELSRDGWLSGANEREGQLFCPACVAMASKE